MPHQPHITHSPLMRVTVCVFVCMCLCVFIPTDRVSVLGYVKRTSDIVASPMHNPVTGRGVSFEDDGLASANRSTIALIVDQIIYQ